MRSLAAVFLMLDRAVCTSLNCGWAVVAVQFAVATIVFDNRPVRLGLAGVTVGRVHRRQPFAIECRNRIIVSRFRWNCNVLRCPKSGRASAPLWEIILRS